MMWKPIKGALTAPVGMRWWNNMVDEQARHEDATETERELDGTDKFVIIEYGEVATK